MAEKPLNFRASDCICAGWPYKHDNLCPSLGRQRAWRMYQRMFKGQGKFPSESLPEPLLQGAMEEVHEESVRADIEHCRKKGIPVDISGYADGSMYTSPNAAVLPIPEYKRSPSYLDALSIAAFNQPSIFSKPVSTRRGAAAKKPLKP
jgi:hypothetical protein